MGNQQVLRIVLSLAILVAFFLPVSNTGGMGLTGEVSAWQVLSESLKNPGRLGQLPSASYVLIVCFFVMLVAAIVLLLVSLLRKSLAAVITFIPFLVTVALLIFTFTQSPVSASETVQVFGSGFYIMLIASFLLLFTNINEKELTANQPSDNRRNNQQSQQHGVKTS